ncbi:hypothetical protein J6590_008295 [Homalodisca vitripennis]|nr:hypothetical protein J6590_008295 [Homalodisca vitripennis]
MVNEVAGKPLGKISFPLEAFIDPGDTVNLFEVMEICNSFIDLYFVESTIGNQHTSFGAQRGLHADYPEDSVS